MALQSFRSGEPNAELAEIAGLKRIRTEYRRGIPLPRFEGQVEFTLNGTRIRAIAVEPKNEWDYRTVRFEEVVSKETAA